MRKLLHVQGAAPRGAPNPISNPNPNPNPDPNPAPSPNPSSNYSPNPNPNPDPNPKAHRTSAVHNESFFVRHFFHLRGATEACRISLRVLGESSSGGHKFKVRSLFIAPGDSGAQRLHDYL